MLHAREENWSLFPFWKTGLKPRGHGAGPRAESLAPAPHSPGAFPRSGLVGLDFPNPSSFPGCRAAL